MKTPKFLKALNVMCILLFSHSSVLGQVGQIISVDLEASPQISSADMVKLGTPVLPIAFVFRNYLAGQGITIEIVRDASEPLIISKTLVGETPSLFIKQDRTLGYTTINNQNIRIDERLAESIDAGFTVQIMYKNASLFTQPIRIDKIQFPNTTNRLSNRPSPSSDNSNPVNNNPPPSNPIISHAQGLLSDAINLDQALEKNDVRAVFEILKNYSEVEESVKDSLRVYFKDNPFIIVRLDSLQDGARTYGSSTPSSETGVSSLKNGLPSPTIVLDALSTFISNRFKEEVTIAFLVAFRKKLDKPELKALFPETHKLLTTIDPYHFKAYLQLLKASAKKDLENIMGGTIELVKLDDIKSKFTNKDEFYAVLGALKIVQGIKISDYPADILDSIHAEIDAQDQTNFTGAIRLLTVISNNLRQGAGQVWEKPEALQKLKNRKILNLFVGLVYAREFDTLSNLKLEIPDGTSKSVAELIKNQGPEFTQYVFELSQHVNAIQNHLKTIKAKKEKGEKFGFEDYHGYLSTTVELFETGVDVSAFLNIKIDDNIKAKYIPIATKVLSISEHIHAKEFGLVVINTIDLLQTAVPDDAPYRKDLIKYGAFLSNVTLAKTSDEVLQAIEVAALPVGSYRIKRASRFNLSLNSYAGISGGYEILTLDSQKIKGETGALNGGFTAPVGLAFSVGPKNEQTNGGSSLSFFVSLIDLGALVSFRLQGEDKGLPELEFENVFAPGFYVIYGFKNSPLSFNIGGQYGPRLRKVDDMGGLKIDASAFRLGAAIGIDIPIFSFYTKMPVEKSQN